MLKYTIDSGLEYSEQKITNFDSILSLKCDLAATIFGTLAFKNGTKKMLQFTDTGIETYDARLTITTEDLQYLDDSEFYITIISSSFNRTSNKVRLLFDKNKIKQKIKVAASQQIEELITRLATLEEIIKDIKIRGALSSLKIVNKEDVLPGMVPVSLGGEKFVAKFPFSDVVREVNGIKAVDESIVITLEDVMLKYNGKNAEETVQLLIEVIRKMSGAIHSLLETQSHMANRIKEIELTLARFTTSAIL